VSQCQASQIRAAELGLKIVSRGSSRTSEVLRAKNGKISSSQPLPFLLPFDSPELKAAIEQLRTMKAEDVVLVTSVARAVARGVM